MDEGKHFIQSLKLRLCVRACVAVCRKHAVAHVLAVETWEQGKIGSKGKLGVYQDLKPTTVYPVSQ